MEKNKNFAIQLDPRKSLDENPDYDVAVEVTDARLLKEGVVNIDHHGDGCSVDTPSAIEQAVHSAKYLRQDGVDRELTFATIRPDSDSVGAMALFMIAMECKSTKNEFYNDFNGELVNHIGAIDRGLREKASKDEEIRMLANAIGYIAANHTKDLTKRVAEVADILKEGSANYGKGFVDWDEIREYQSRRDSELEQARKNSKIEVVEGEVNIAFVESKDRFATSLGYAEAPVVVAKNPEFPVDFKDPSKGTIEKWTICRENEFVNFDIAKLRDELNKLEAEKGSDAKWGGQQNIIGSPQGVGSKLSDEEIRDLVLKQSDKF